MIKHGGRVLVTGGTKSDVAAMAVFVLNIKYTNAHLFNKVIIFHDGIKDKNQKKIQAIMDTEFVEYKYPGQVKNDIVINYFSPMLFCKYECLRLLEKYDEVVWSDYDVLIKGKLDEVCQFKKRNLNIVVDGKVVRDMLYEHITNPEIYKYDLKREGLCTPLFSISRNIEDYMEMYRWCYRKTEEYDEDIMLAEQAIFSLMIQEFAKDYTALDASKYACHPTNAQGNEIILHSYGQPKFWNGLYNDEWNQLYVEWLNMGGSPYLDFLKKVKAKIKLFITRLQGIRAKK